MNVKGTETQNQSDNRAMRVEKGIAAELSLAHKTRFMTKNSMNTILHQITITGSVNIYFPNKMLTFKTIMTLR